MQPSFYEKYMSPLFFLLAPSLMLLPSPNIICLTISSVTDIIFISKHF